MKRKDLITRQEAAERDLRRKAMFYLGWTQQEIADHEGVIKNTIVSWRKCRGIKPNMIGGTDNGDYLF